LQHLTGQVRAARARWAAASARAAFYGGAFLESARRILEMARAGYRIGRTSLIAVLQAQNDLSSANSRALDAALDAQRALADLEEATGADL
jgi:outer membrane protein TolC